MNFPFSIQIGEIKLLWHSLLEPVAFFIGFRFFLYLRKRQGDVIRKNRVWILMAAIFGALIGSRILGGLEDPRQIAIADNVWIYFYQNKTVLGGFLGGLWGVELVKKIIGEKQASRDLFVYPMLLALFIGRIGCFSMGVYEETYGIETTAITGMNLGDGLKRHPVALYEMFFLCLLCFCLIVLDKKIKLENGARFKLFMIAYILFRLFLDFIKPHYTLSVGLSIIQVACILGLLWYAPYIIKPKKLLLPINQKLKPVQKTN